MVSVIGTLLLSFERTLGPGNNINTQVQVNSGNNAGPQSDAGNMYSGSPIFQGQSTEHDSQVISQTFNRIRQKDLWTG